MKKKFRVATLSATLFALCFPVEAQQAKKVPRIGFVWPSGDPNTPGREVGLFGQALGNLGYTQGKNIAIEYRGAEGRLDRIPSLVAELVQSKVDVLVISGLPAVRAGKQATKTIPIVMLMGVDPVATGIVDSLALPGGNITGLSTLIRELSGKRLQLLKEAVPRMSRVGVLWEAGAEGATMAFNEYEAAARALKIPLQSLEVRGPNPDFEGAFQVAAKARANALISITSYLLSRFPNLIASLAIKSRLPSMYEGREYVEVGGLMTYEANQADFWRRAAVHVDKILKGTKPADIPVEQPMKFDFVINLKTAKQIGVTIPQWTLTKADRVIR